MISLYDHLGRAAGPALGYAVAKYASKNNAKVGLREISNPAYTGKINLYEPEFLESFFSNKEYTDVIQKDIEWFNNKRKNK